MLWLSNFSRLLPESRKVPRLPRHFGLYAGCGYSPRTGVTVSVGVELASQRDCDCGGASFYKLRPPRWSVAANVAVGQRQYSWCERRMLPSCGRASSFLGGVKRASEREGDCGDVLFGVSVRRGLVCHWVNVAGHSGISAAGASVHRGRLAGIPPCWYALGTAAKWGAGPVAGSSFHDFIVG